MKHINPHVKIYHEKKIFYSILWYDEAYDNG